ncbi:MAG: PAS domain-containing protein, partial [Candidatus Micrarchaeota archaeon]|nr:PAS domain-containing protein [Candidatus Micrarchaeota archaeon]
MSKSDIDTFKSGEFDSVKKYLDLVGAIVIILDLKGNVKYINTYGANLIGYSFEQIIGKNWFDNFIPSRIRKELKDIFSKIIATNDGIKKYYHYENPILTKNGEEIVIAWNNILFESEDGRIIGTLSTGMDVTEKKLIYATKKSYEDKLSFLNYFATTLNSAKSIKEIYEHVIEGLTKTLGYEYAVI